MDEARERPAAIDSRTFASLEDIADGDRDFLREVIGQFLDDAAARVAQLMAALAAADADSLFRAAHALKSSSANLGALGLSALADRLQRLGRERRLDDADDLARAAAHEFQRVHESLSERLAKLNP